MVKPSLDSTQPDGSELPTFSYGGEGIPRVLKQYRNQLNQSARRTIDLDDHWLR